MGDLNLEFSYSHFGYSPQLSVINAFPHFLFFESLRPWCYPTSEAFYIRSFQHLTYYRVPTTSILPSPTSHMTSSLPRGDYFEVTCVTCYGPLDHPIWLNTLATYPIILLHQADVSCPSILSNPIISFHVSLLEPITCQHVSLSEPIICHHVSFYSIEKRACPPLVLKLNPLLITLSTFLTNFNTIHGSPMSQHLKGSHIQKF